MADQHKSILINAIINTLNEQIKRENKSLCEQNLYSQQKPLHGGDMLFKLAFLTDAELKKIASACGL